MSSKNKENKMKTNHEQILEMVNEINNDASFLNESNLINLAQKTLIQMGTLSQHPKRTELKIDVDHGDGSSTIYNFKKFNDVFEFEMDMETYGSTAIKLVVS